MNATFAIGLAVASNLVLSFGMLLQKKYVGWLSAKDRKTAEFRRDMLLWMIGFLLMNLAPVPRFFALMGLPINTVNAFFGSNVAFTAIMAVFILKERMRARQMAWSAFLLLALVLASIRGGAPETSLDRVGLIAFCAIPALAGIALWLASRKKPSVALAVLLAAASGAAGGYMNLPMKAVQTGGLGLGALVFYIGLYVVAGALSFAFIQVAYKDGEMSVVSPAMYGFQVLWPALASFWVFHSTFDPVQALALAAIALSVYMVSRPDTAARPGAPGI